MNKLAGALAAFGGIGCAVKNFVVDKKISQNQESKEQQVDNKKVLEENEENNNQDSGNSDNAGNTEISSVGIVCHYCCDCCSASSTKI